MNIPEISIGTAGEASMTVDLSKTAEALGSGTVAVLGTPAMVALMEAAAISAIKDALPDGLTTVGISLDIQHLAATPVGVLCRAEASVTQVEGRIITFDVTASDNVEVIGRGTHRRAIVDTPKFLQRAASKVSR